MHPETLTERFDIERVWLSASCVRNPFYQCIVVVHWWGIDSSLDSVQQESHRGGNVCPRIAYAH
jgi:hypothetical protein